MDEEQVKKEKPKDDKETLKVIYETNYSQLNKMLDSITDMDQKLTIAIAIDSIALPLIIGNTPTSKLFQFLLCFPLTFIAIGFFYAIFGLKVKPYKDSPDPRKLYDSYHDKCVEKLYSAGAKDFADKYQQVKEQSDIKKNKINESFLFSAIGLIVAIFIIFISKCL
jgi:hypothetical protein